jgi:hypothetical protein
VSPLAPTNQLADALTPAKLRKDGIRLGLVAGLSILYAILFEQPVLDVLLIGVNGFGVLVGMLAVAYAAFSLRRHGRAAAIAMAVYGACTVAHVVAIIGLLRH